ncbi:MAG: septum formation initiator family protein [Clostridia bacterium]|nr:septum formation initiator family protein [Clostridia bacterium]
MSKEIKEVKINKYKGSLILKIALICFAIYLIFMLVVQRSEIGKKEAEKLMLQNDILQQEQVNHEIEYSIEKNALGVDEYAEEYARSELDYVKQGEKVFVDIGGN